MSTVERDFPKARAVDQEQVGLEKDPVIPLYFSDLKKIGNDLLSFEEELVLGKAIAEEKAANEALGSQTSLGDGEKKELIEAAEEGEIARASIIVRNLRLVIHIAKRYRYRGVPFADLIGEGNMGLIRATEDFDPQKGRFSTYAGWWIRQAITRAIEEQGRTIRLPPQAYQDRGRLLRQAREMMQQEGREPTNEELAQTAGMDEKYVRLLLSPTMETTSLETLVGEEQESELGSFVADESDDGQDISKQITIAAMRCEVMECVKKLRPREQLVISLRFGLEDGRERTFAEIGEMIGVSKERAQVIQLKALRRLRLRAAPRFPELAAAFERRCKQARWPLTGEV